MEVCQNIFATTTACLVAGGLAENTARIIVMLLNALFFTVFPLLLAILVIWMERRLGARVQIRLGPNRVGPQGLLQNVADAIKLLGKEDITPAGTDRIVYNIAPMLMLGSVVLIWSVIPFSIRHVGADLDIGALYVIAVSSIGTLGIVMAGWSSNNKYALLGAFRTVALLVSYEVPLVLSMLVPVMLAGTMNLQEIVQAQSGTWYIFAAPVAALLFYVSNLAEVGRAPFDLIEAESELVAGYNIEYSGMKFGLFMVGEFLHAFSVNVLFVVFFLGGWTGPGAETYPLLGFVYLSVKTMLMYVIMIVIRFSVPRIRVDQMLNLNWKFFVPLSVANLLIVALIVKVAQISGWADLSNGFFWQSLPVSGMLLIGNVLLVIGTSMLMQRTGRSARLQDQQAAKSGIP